FAAYYYVTNCQFTNFDDDRYVENNAAVRTGLTAQNLRWALTTRESANWHPLTWVSLQLDATLYGNRAGGYHLSNLIIHVASTISLFLVLRRMTQAACRSVLVAAFFGLHPLHVESVAWIFERKDVLSALFWILTMGAYARFAERPNWRTYLLVIL